jgi:hypothetical protein
MAPADLAAAARAAREAAQAAQGLLEAATRRMERAVAAQDQREVLAALLAVVDIQRRQIRALEAPVAAFTRHHAEEAGLGPEDPDPEPRLN